MTVNDHDRIITLEAEQGMLKRQVGEMRADFAMQIVSVRNHHADEFAKINVKLDEIFGMVNKGKGAKGALGWAAAVVGVLFSTAIALWTTFFK